MAKLVAYIDFYSPLWETELPKVKNEDLKEWLLNNCKCDEPEECDKDEVYDGILYEGADYRITFGDWGIIEEIKLIIF